MASETDWRTALALAVSAAIPISLLPALTGEPRRTLGLSAAPFGPPLVLAVQVVAALPLGWLLASKLGRPSARHGLAGRAMAGLFVLGLTAAIGPMIAAGLDRAHAGFLARATLRSAIAVVLVIPWLLPAMRQARPGAVPRVGLPALAVGAVLAILPPLVFADRLTETRSAQAAEDLDTGRLVKALRELEELRELGSWRPVAGASPRDLVRPLRSRLGQLERAAARPLPRHATPAHRMERAFLMVQLGRSEEAKALLEPSAAGGDADAALLLAAVYRDQQRWGECERLYQQVIDASRPRVGRDDRAIDRSVAAYDGLADALRSSGRFRDAGRVLLEARAALPSRSAYYSLRLGRYDLDRGRPASALGWFDEAVRIDPSLRSQVRSLTHRARMQTPACLLRFLSDR